MGSGIGLILENAKKALTANQTGIAATSHNVANVNTQGYSRQRVEFGTSPPTNYGKHQLGNGVDVGAVTRATSEFVNRRIESENSILGRLEGSSEVLGQIENIFKDEGEGGISNSVSKFFNDIRSLSVQPESAPLKSAVRESAVALSSRFKSVTDSLSEVVKDLDRRIDGSVTQINTLSEKIATLNRRIMEVSARGGQPNDELDSRDLAVKDLAKLINIQVTPLENHGINIQSGRLGVLINATESFQLQASRSAEGPYAGSLRVYTVPEEGSSHFRDVTDFVQDGMLGGYLKTRDQNLPKITEKIDNLAYTLSNHVNEIHRTGFTRNGQTGIDFFKAPTSVKGAAENLKLSDQVMNNVSNIVTAKAQAAAGDNRVLLQISELEDKKIFENGTASFMDYNSTVVGNVGVESRAVFETFNNQRDVLNQLDALREQTSGVSLDEEALNMVKFQRAFDASAKMIQTADSMLDTVLNLKRF